jgi:hypothetical protein
MEIRGNTDCVCSPSLLAVSCSTSLGPSVLLSVPAVEIETPSLMVVPLSPRCSLPPWCSRRLLSSIFGSGRAAPRGFHWFVRHQYTCCSNYVEECHQTKVRPPRGASQQQSEVQPVPTWWPILIFLAAYACSTDCQVTCVRCVFALVPVLSYSDVSYNLHAVSSCTIMCLRTYGSLVLDFLQ